MADNGIQGHESKTHLLYITLLLKFLESQPNLAPLDAQRLSASWPSTAGPPLSARMIRERLTEIRNQAIGNQTVNHNFKLPCSNYHPTRKRAAAEDSNVDDVAADDDPSTPITKKMKTESTRTPRGSRSTTATATASRSGKKHRPLSDSDDDSLAGIADDTPSKRTLRTRPQLQSLNKYHLDYANDAASANAEEDSEDEYDPVKAHEEGMKGHRRRRLGPLG